MNDYKPTLSNNNQYSTDNTDKISGLIDNYVDKTRKSISQWLNAYMEAEMRVYQGSRVLPIKKTLQDVYQYTMLDTHLSSVVDQRKSKTLGEKYGIFSNGNVDDAKTELLNKKWFGKFVDAVLDSRFYGYNCIQFEDLIKGEICDLTILPKGNVIPELKTVLKNPYNPYQGYSVVDRPDSDYYVLVDSGNLGLLNKVVAIAIIKRITLAYWSEHSENFGVPITVLKTENKDKLDQFNQQLTNFVRSRKIIIANDDNFEVLQSSNVDAHKIYKELIETCNSEISKLIVGATMLSDNGSSLSQSQVHWDVAEDIAEQDREYVEFCINDLLLPKLINLGYPFSKDDKFKYITREKRSYEDKLNTIKMLKDAGYSTNPENIKDYLDLPFDVEAIAPVAVPEPVPLKKKVRSKQ